MHVAHLGHPHPPLTEHGGLKAPGGGLVAKLFSTLATPWTSLPGSSVHFLGENTGVGGHSLLPGDPPDPGIKPGLLHCR